MHRRAATACSGRRRFSTSATTAWSCCLTPNRTARSTRRCAVPWRCARLRRSGSKSASMGVTRTRIAAAPDSTPRAAPTRRPAKAAEVLAREIVDHILKAQLPPGTRLPNEKQMVETTGRDAARGAAPARKSRHHRDEARRGGRADRAQPAAGRSRRSADADPDVRERHAARRDDRAAGHRARHLRSRDTPAQGTASRRDAKGGGRAARADRRSRNAARRIAALPRGDQRGRRGAR